MEPNYSSMNHLYNVGELVVFKTHPLLKDFEIRGDGKYVPPIMIIKEVLFENKQKKTNDDISDLIIAERIKYICVYFDDNKSEFVEAHLYQSCIVGIKDLKIGRYENLGLENNSKIAVIDEILALPLSPSYNFGGILYFKTKKLEVLKKRSSTKTTYENGTSSKKKSIQYVVNYATPDFVVSGFKKESYTDLFYNDGNKKRLASSELFKVKWYNPIHQKFSEEYLPKEFFTDIDPFPNKANAENMIEKLLDDVDNHNN